MDNTEWTAQKLQKLSNWLLCYQLPFEKEMIVFKIKNLNNSVTSQNQSVG